MVNLRRTIGVTQICLGIFLIIACVYFSNLFAASQMLFAENAASHFQAANVPEEEAIQTNYILLSNLHISLMVNFGIATIITLLAMMMILQGIVNKFAIPRLNIGHRPLVWLALIGLATVLIILLINQWFMNMYF
jgi:hypothetical protein